MSFPPELGREHATNKLDISAHASTSCLVADDSKTLIFPGVILLIGLVLPRLFLKEGSKESY